MVIDAITEFAPNALSPVCGKGYRRVAAGARVAASCPVFRLENGLNGLRFRDTLSVPTCIHYILSRIEANQIGLHFWRALYFCHCALVLMLSLPVQLGRLSALRRA